MIDPSPYEKLEVTESASFDEIQEARNRLIEKYSDDRKQIEMVEAAYDAVLMDRLRRRQEGKIKVPEGIRYPEKLAKDEAPNFAPSPPKQAPAWLQQFIDTPSRADILWPAGLFLSLGALSFYYPGLALAIGVGASLYFVNRKERKFGRALLLTLVGLLIGVLGGVQLYTVLGLQMPVSGDSFAAMITFFLFWVISSFLR